MRCQWSTSLRNWKLLYRTVDRLSWSQSLLIKVLLLKRSPPTGRRTKLLTLLGSCEQTILVTHSRRHLSLIDAFRWLLAILLHLVVPQSISLFIIHKLFNHKRLLKVVLQVERVEVPIDLD